LKCLIDENNQIKETKIPKQVIYHIYDIYEKSLKGYKITTMSHLIYDSESTFSKNNEDYSLLDNNEIIAFLYFKPSDYHLKCCLKNIKEKFIENNFLISFLIQKSEILWAKLFPLRLYLRLSEEENGK
jgi:hypothetical protein